MTSRNSLPVLSRTTPLFHDDHDRGHASAAGREQPSDSVTRPFAIPQVRWRAPVVLMVALHALPSTVYRTDLFKASILQRGQPMTRELLRCEQGARQSQRAALAPVL